MGRTVGETNADYYADPENSREMVESTALRRLGTEADIAGIVHALVSPDGAWITGQVIDATGGYKL
jgi:NAD(P)-dependent dehydrogenase (short-subunit alcohol dehydrogenase family)